MKKFILVGLCAAFGTLCAALGGVSMHQISINNQYTNCNAEILNEPHWEKGENGCIESDLSLKIAFQEQFFNVNIQNFPCTCQNETHVYCPRQHDVLRIWVHSKTKTIELQLKEPLMNYPGALSCLVTSGIFFAFALAVLFFKFPPFFIFK
jgi:hypothetical protein